MYQPLIFPAPLDCIDFLLVVECGHYCNADNHPGPSRIWGGLSTTNRYYPGFWGCIGFVNELFCETRLQSVQQRRQSQSLLCIAPSRTLLRFPKAAESDSLLALVRPRCQRNIAPYLESTTNGACVVRNIFAALVFLDGEVPKAIT